MGQMRTQLLKVDVVISYSKDVFCFSFKPRWFAITSEHHRGWTIAKKMPPECFYPEMRAWLYERHQSCTRSSRRLFMNTSLEDHQSNSIWISMWSKWQDDSLKTVLTGSEEFQDSLPCKDRTDAFLERHSEYFIPLIMTKQESKSCCSYWSQSGSVLWQIGVTRRLISRTGTHSGQNESDW